MTTLAITFGKKLFQFSSKADWIQNASENWKQHHVQTYRTTCVDQLGRICTIGLHFSEAERDNAYPIDVFLTRPSDQVEGGAA